MIRLPLSALLLLVFATTVKAQSTVALTSVEGVGYGASSDQLATAGLRLRPATGEYASPGEYDVLGMRGTQVTIERGRFTSLILTEGSRLRTLSGIGVGTPVSQLRRAYGRRLTGTSCILGDYNPYILYYVSPDAEDRPYLLAFYVDDGRVSSIVGGFRTASGGFMSDTAFCWDDRGRN